MASTALFIVHKTQPGQRDAVRKIWLAHMAPAIQANPGHLAYFYMFDQQDEDTICAFQHYESAQAAQDFLQNPSYLAYLQESRPLLAHDPQVFSLAPQWVKSA